MKGVLCEKISPFLLLAPCNLMDDSHFFYLSHQPGEESSDLSGGLMALLNSILPFDLLEDQTFHTLLRKGAHISAYFVLSLLVMNAFGQLAIVGKRRVYMTFAISLAYAISDEVHQLFIPGRSGQVTDVLIDCLGSAIGIACYSLFVQLKKNAIGRKLSVQLS